MGWLKDRSSETSTWISIVTFIAYVIVYFTPDDIDIIVNDVRDIICLFLMTSTAIIGVVTKEKK